MPVSDKQVLAKTARKPKTRKELGASFEQLRKLEASGAIQRVGVRPTGGRGRPSVEYRAA